MCVCTRVRFVVVFESEHVDPTLGGAGDNVRTHFLDCARADMKVCSAKPNILLTNKIVAITVSEAFVNIV